jgi:hypothetical protein
MRGKKGSRKLREGDGENYFIEAVGLTDLSPLFCDIRGHFFCGSCAFSFGITKICNGG